MLRWTMSMRLLTIANWNNNKERQKNACFALLFIPHQREQLSPVDLITPNKWVYKESFRASITYKKCCTDVGVVKKTPTRVDLVVGWVKCWVLLVVMQKFGQNINLQM